ncbi:hypothetical protein RB2150_12751 [Rhodobacteraceae bacterium HTCC2150]|nr:hypothetical protein RB2150_12751 [Rhodobacteraceae bacterium HTCC2150]
MPALTSSWAMGITSDGDTPRKIAMTFLGAELLTVRPLFVFDMRTLSPKG